MGLAKFNLKNCNFKVQSLDSPSYPQAKSSLSSDWHDFQFERLLVPFFSQKHSIK